MAANNLKYSKRAEAVLALSILVAALYWLGCCSESNNKAPAVRLDANSTDVAASPTSGMADDDGALSTAPSPSPEALPLEGLPIPARDDEYVDAVIRVPVHHWHKERSDNIGTETIEETISKLANLDDLHLAHTSISGIPPISGCPAFQSLAVTRLARVRRVLAVGRDDPSRMVPHLRKAYEDSLILWPKAYWDMQRLLDAGEKQRGLYQFDKCIVHSVAATYLLAELEDHESLPLLLKGYEIHGYPSSTTKIRAPVPPALTLYAMHRLVQSFPEEQLNAEARAVRDNYLEQAKCLRPPRDIIVTKSWYAKYDESDPRIAVLDREGKVLRDEPTMSMVVYPYRFTDGEPVSNADGKVFERAKMLFAELEKFIEAQY